MRRIIQISKHVTNIFGFGACLLQKNKNLVVDGIDDTALNLFNEDCREFDIFDLSDVLQLFETEVSNSVLNFLKNFNDRSIGRVDLEDSLMH